MQKHNVMYKLIRDCGTVEVSPKVYDLLCAIVIDDCQSELYHWHQNFAKRQFKVAKSYTNTIMNCNGAPFNTWLLCMVYVMMMMMMMIGSLGSRSFLILLLMIWLGELF